jgi:polygalacturonase
LLSAPLCSAVARAADAGASRAAVTDFGAIANGGTVNTTAIQAAIDHLAGKGGGTVVVPQGVFVSGALFLKPKVNLHLDKGAVLQCSTDVQHFPVQRTRIEGHFEDKFNPALINANGCDGLRISGEGTFDGAGRPVWDQFWKLRNAHRTA